VSFVDAAGPPVRAGSAAQDAGHDPTRAPASPDLPTATATERPASPDSLEPLAADAPWRPRIATLSYTSLSSYERCPYRFYAERILGLPESPPIAPEPEPDAPVLSRQTVRGAARGRLIHELLAGIDFRRPSLREPMPADIRALLAGLIGSSSFVRIAALSEVRREQRFAFPVAQTLITGVFDLIGREFRDDQLLVVDYKSDSLAGADPGTIVAERYLAQRATYALAALKLGAAAVEVAHLFLEAPDEPVTTIFTAAEADALERELAARVAGPLAGNFPVTSAPSRRVCEGCPARDGLCSYPLELTNRL
jgi:ATP-dependent exoDNAse (exonuclease V) beta subunit